MLQEVNLPIISNSQCEQLYENAGYKEFIPSIFICAGYQKGGQDSCEVNIGEKAVHFTSILSSERSDAYKGWSEAESFPRVNF